MPSSSSDARQEYMNQLINAQYERMQMRPAVQWDGVNVVNYGFTSGTVDTKRDTKSLAELLEKGWSKSISIYSKEGFMGFWGNNDLLFTIEGDKLRVNQKSRKHLLPQLKKLAKTDGLALELLDADPKVYDELSRHYFWQRDGEFDDSDLVSFELPREEPDELVFNDGMVYLNDF